MFRYLVEQAGLEDKYEVDSAGTASYHVGESPDARMRKVAREYGLVYDGSARQVTQQDFNGFDLIIPMDMSNKANLMRMANGLEHEAIIHTMRTFDPQGGPADDVPDPYYGGVDGFHTTYRIVERSCKGLLDALESGEIEV